LYWTYLVYDKIYFGKTIVTKVLVLVSGTRDPLNKGHPPNVASKGVFAEVSFPRGGKTPPGDLNDAVERLRHSPLFEAVSLWRKPLGDGRSWSWAKVPGYIPKPGDDNFVHMAQVEPGYFRATAVPMLAGRDFEEKERIWPPRVVTVSESFAKRYFAGKSPLGVKFRFFQDDTFEPTEIVGVVRDARLAPYGSRLVISSITRIRER
jgi:hypothetical protein